MNLVQGDDLRERMATRKYEGGICYNAVIESGISIATLEHYPGLLKELLKVAWAAWTMLPPGQPETAALKSVLDRIDPICVKLGPR